MRPDHPFHLAFPVDDLEAARGFYARQLGCGVGRESERWIDFDFFGHQITAHLAPEECAVAGRNPVDGESIPVRHFGLVLDPPQWRELAGRLEREGVPFYLQPTTRFAGGAGEQGTFFVTDPAGNMLEFKCFADPGRLFARDGERPG